MALEGFPAALENQFRPIRRLAAGGYGAVFVAEQVALGRTVALKVLHAQALADPGTLARFRAEAKITAALRHPNIVQVFDHGVDGGVPWIAYELVEGRALEERLAGGALPWAEACDIARQVAEALAAAHALNILHRDIKPANVLQTSDGTVKVADFGIAKWADVESIQTENGIVLGTPAYISPEQVSGEPARPASDIYALGAMLYELLTGRPPWVNPELRELLMARLTERPRPPSERAPGLPGALNRVVLAALERDPAVRLASARAFADELAAVTRSPARTVAAAPLPEPARGPSAAWRAPLALALCALALGLAVWRARAPVAVAASLPPGAASPTEHARITELGLRQLPLGMYVYVGLSRPERIRGEVQISDGSAPPQQLMLDKQDSLARITVNGLRPETTYAVSLTWESDGQYLLDHFPFRTRRPKDEDDHRTWLALIKDLNGTLELHTDLFRNTSDVRVAEALAARIAATRTLPISDAHLWMLASSSRNEALVKALWDNDPNMDQPEWRALRSHAASRVQHPGAVERADRFLEHSPGLAEYNELISVYLEQRPPLVEKFEHALDRRAFECDALCLYTAIAPDRARKRFQSMLATTPATDGVRLNCAIAGLRTLDDDAAARVLGELGRRSTNEAEVWGTAWALERMATPAAAVEIRDLLARHAECIEAVRAAGAARGETDAAVAKLVLQVLTSNGLPAIRRAAALSMAWLPGGVEELAGVASLPDPVLAEAAAWALGHRREPGAVPVLTALFDTPRDRYGVAGWALARCLPAGLARDRLVQRLVARFRELSGRTAPDAQNRWAIAGQSLVELGDASLADRSVLIGKADRHSTLYRLLLPYGQPGEICVSSLGLATRVPLAVLPLAANLSVSTIEAFPARGLDRTGGVPMVNVTMLTADEEDEPSLDHPVVAKRPTRVMIRMLAAFRRDGNVESRDWGDPEDPPFVYRIWLRASPNATILGTN